MNEGAGAGRWTGSPFDSMLGLAIRRHCAPLLGLEPHVDADTYLGRRRALGHDEVARRMLGAAGIDTLLVDTGFLPDDICSPAEVAALAGPAPARTRSLRLETIAQDLLASGTAIARPADRRRAAARGVRGGRRQEHRGLPLRPRPPRRAAARPRRRSSPCGELRPDDAGAYRITDRTVDQRAGLDGDRGAAAAAVPRRVRRQRRRPAPLRPAAPDAVPAGHPVARRAGAAAAQLPVPPPRGVPRPGLRPRLHGRRPGGAQHRRAVAAGDRGDPRAGAVRQAAALLRRLRAGRALLPRAALLSAAAWTRCSADLVDATSSPRPTPARIGARVAGEQRAAGLRARYQ